MDTTLSMYFVKLKFILGVTFYLPLIYKVDMYAKAIK